MIAYLNREEPVVDFINQERQEGKSIFISFVSFVEVLSLSHLSEVDVQTIKNFLQEFVTVQTDIPLLELSSFLRRKYRLNTPDAIVAATALSFGVPLLTRDHHFRKIKELTLAII